MNDPFARFRRLMQDIQDLSAAAAVLDWDRFTYMPPGGAEARARQSAALARLVHERQTSDEMGELLEGLREDAATLVPGSAERGLIELAGRDYARARAVPADLVVRMSETFSLAAGSWEIARADDDLASFLPHLERIFDLLKEYAACFPGVAHPYDALLDRVEEGLTKAEVERLFAALLAPQRELLQRILDGGVVLEDGFLHRRFPRAAQLAASREVAELIGYDLSRGRLDTVVHPFSTAFSINDVRITTRVYEDFLSPCLYGTLHEAGHALYEQGISSQLEGLPIAGAASAGVHESQSRLFENLVGRSRAFSRTLLPLLRRHFPSQLADVNEDAFFRAVNTVRPSCIRVEADEVSYNLHVIIRFEIEVAILEGRLDVKDVGEAWNTTYREYLGITPPSHREGVLQDVQWSCGWAGQFQSYAIGNVVASQWWDLIARDIPDRDELLAHGEVAPIREWLREHVHQHGHVYTPQELIRKATGGPIDSGPYLRYLGEKYGELYEV